MSKVPIKRIARRLFSVTGTKHVYGVGVGDGVSDGLGD